MSFQVQNSLRKSRTKITSMPCSQRISKICVDCTGLIGDTLLRTPFIESLRAIFPTATISAVVHEGREALLRNHPDIHSVMTFRRRRGSPLKAYVSQSLKFIWRLRSERYDLYVDLYGGGHSVWLMLFSGASYKLGFSHKVLGRWVSNMPAAYPDASGHLSSMFQPLLKSLGVSENQLRLRRGATFVPSDQAIARAKLQYVAANKGLVLLTLGGGDQRKLWGVDKFAELSVWLDSEQGFSVGVFRSPGQEALLDGYESACARVGYAGYTVIESTDFDDIGALLSVCKFHVTGDTGYMHLGIGVKCPSVGLFTHTRPEPVWPEDCVFVPCFAPSNFEFDDLGRALGSDLSVHDVCEAVTALLREVNSSSLG